MAGVFNIGGVVDALAGRKTKKLYVSDPLQAQIDASISGLPQYRADIARGLGAYEAGMGENIAGQKALSKEAIANLGRVGEEVIGGDWMADRERIRGGDLGSLTALLGSIGGGMSAADKLAQARLGYAGRPSGTYVDKARQAYLGSFASPLAATIYAGLNPGASSADVARRGKAGTVASIESERSKALDRPTDRMLAVPAARSEFLGSEIGALGGLGDAAKQNFMGIQETKNKWAAALGEVDKATNSALDTAMSLYGMGGMGGFGGAAGGAAGAAGGAGGGGDFWSKMLQRAPQAAPPAYGYGPPPPYYTPPAWGTPPYNYSGGRRGGNPSGGWNPNASNPYAGVSEDEYLYYLSGGQ